MNPCHDQRTRFFNLTRLAMAWSSWQLFFRSRKTPPASSDDHGKPMTVRQLATDTNQNALKAMVDANKAQ
eukprot:1194099-Pyramimonas_sp.AAC.1